MTAAPERNGAWSTGGRIVVPHSQRGHSPAESHGCPTGPLQPTTVPADPRALDATDCNLQEITAVGRRLEAMDLKITDLSPASASIRTDIACFSEKVADLDQCLMNVEDHIGMLPEHDAELRTL
ncbi:hypothetical protein NDU88_001962 [Pleurodeles waltl]|uniref:Uncharacterized protein n=1 Tax=Pleurodeles waltl TaxID=8319 RepID=A0AAV7TL88_PLEWA|nr:hypothetical protein NDU88_001962 [Pleurodeles waltl]